jgi:hypothetical protein
MGRLAFILLFIIFASDLSAHSQQVFVEGAEDGQGFLFYTGGCYVVTPLHVAAGQNPNIANGATVHILLARGAKLAASSVANQSWAFPDIDIAVLQLESSNDCLAGKPEPLPAVKMNYCFGIVLACCNIIRSYGPARLRIGT